MKKLLSKMSSSVFSAPVRVQESAAPVQGKATWQRDVQRSFFYALKTNDIAMVKLLSKAHPQSHTWVSPPNPAYPSQPHGIPAIFYAIEASSEMTQWFIERGADIEVQHPITGATPLYMAVDRNAYGIEPLLNAGANPYACPPGKSDMKFRAMSYGEMTFDVVLNMLLEARARYDARMNRPPLIARKPQAGSTP